MKGVYPVFIKKTDEEYLVYLPDVDCSTSGESMYDAICMARDLLGSYSLDGEPMPTPSDEATARQIAKEKADDEDLIFSNLPITMVDIDTEEYRKQLNTKSVKKNCTIPGWLNEKAEAAGLNFSKILQEALTQRLGL